VVAVTVVVVGTVLVTVSFWGPETTITATTTPNPSASADARIKAILVARPAEGLGGSKLRRTISTFSFDIACAVSVDTALGGNPLKADSGPPGWVAARQNMRILKAVSEKRALLLSRESRSAAFRSAGVMVLTFTG
jgi:hypothetical protein